jgi:multiple sugar transport system substrate-binding protein
MLANAFDAEPFTNPDCVIPSQPAGAEALRLLRELVQQAAPGSLERNPIKTWQLLATSDTVAYCPFAYGYSNYSRNGYATHTLQTGGLISLHGKQLRSTLGGAGLAVSKHCKHREAAIQYARFVASADTQRTLYAFSGGQPGHRAAWLDPDLDAHTHDFFRNTVSTLDAAWVRPRFPGFIAFQDAASIIVHDYLVQGGSEQSVLERIDAALHQHRLPGASA